MDHVDNESEESYIDDDDDDMFADDNVAIVESHTDLVADVRGGQRQEEMQNINDRAWHAAYYEVFIHPSVEYWLDGNNFQINNGHRVFPTTRIRMIERIAALRRMVLLLDFLMFYHIFDILDVLYHYRDDIWPGNDPLFRRLETFFGDFVFDGANTIHEDRVRASSLGLWWERLINFPDLVHQYRDGHWVLPEQPDL